MDLTFKTQDGIFNYRVAAVILHNDELLAHEKLLALKNDLTPYYFLPGGRVRMGENAESAMRRELKEELGIDANIVRPLWFVESFFVEDVTKDEFHELCLYYLVDVSDTNLPNNNTFFGLETKHREVFTWLDVKTLKDTYIYPLFLKTELTRLPQSLEFRTEYEN